MSPAIKLPGPALRRFGATLPPFVKRLLFAALCLAAFNPPAAAQADYASQSLEPGVRVERELRAGEKHAYALALDAGQVWTASFAGQGFQLEVALYDPAGGLVLTIRQDDSIEETQRRPALLVAEAPGTYRLEVRATQKSGAGLYRLGPAKVAAASESDRTIFTAVRADDEGRRLEAEGTAESQRRAIARYEEGAAVWRRAGERAHESTLLARAGAVYARLAEYQKALEVLGAAAEAARAAQAVEREEDVLGNMAYVYSALGDYRKSLDANLRTLELARTLGHRRNEAVVLNNIAMIHVRNEDDVKALEFFEQARPIYREVRDPKSEATLLNNLGGLYARRHETEKALEYFNRALSLRRETNDRIGEASTLSNIATVYSYLKEYEKAHALYERGLALCRAGGFRKGEESTLFGMALMLGRMERLQEAAARMEEVVSLLESIRTELVSQDLRASFRASLEAEYKFYIEVLMRLHAKDPAAGFDRKAFELSERAHALALLERLAEARVNLRQDVDASLLEQERRVQQQLGTKLTAERALLAGKHTEEEAAAARRAVEELLARLEELEAQIRTNSPRYSALTRPRAASVVEAQKLLDPDTLLLEFSLDRDHSYLWVVAKDSFEGYALAGSAEIEQAARRFLGTLAARGERVRFEAPAEWRARVAKADAEFPQAAAEATRLILGGAATRLGGKRLLVVADGVLHYVPFAALAAAPSLDAAAYRPLLAEHEIANVPSASVLGELRREATGRAEAPKAVAVFADPVFDGGDERVRALSSRNAKPPQPNAPEVQLADATRAARAAGVAGESEAIPRLLYTRREADEILRLVPPSRRFGALDFEASRAAATEPGLGQFRIVHFATHGFSNPAHPELSGLVLSLVDRGGRATDGFLTANDIFHLKLPAELVVLSGCRTGLGRDVKGEGLVGLTRGFMYAGAERVVYSLWDVNDEATAELMAQFYRGMLGAERKSPSAALRAAQLALWRKRQWQSPYYWSAFVLQGEPR